MPPKPQPQEKVMTMTMTVAGQTPIADWYSTKSVASSVNDLQLHQTGLGVMEGDDGDKGEEEEEDDSDDDDDVRARRRTVMGRGRCYPISSQLSLNHFGMNDNELGTEEDWTRSVLLAADMDFGFESKQ
jgi:hypothetical protein